MVMTLQESIKYLIEELVQDEMSLMEMELELFESLSFESLFEDFNKDSDFNPILKVSSKNLPKSRNKLSASTPEEQEVEKLFHGLIRRRGGKARLSKTDMERLDYITRWMKYLPGGRSFRRGLAKYVKSKKDNVRVDPFRDFRRYNYNHGEEQE